MAPSCCRRATGRRSTHQTSGSRSRRSPSTTPTAPWNGATRKVSMPIIPQQRSSARPTPSRKASRTTDGKAAEVGDARVVEVKLSKSWFTRRGLLAAAVGAFVAVLVLVLYAAGALDGLERQSVDQRFSWRGRQSSGTDIVIVGIDQKTLQTVGTRPPLPRADYANEHDQIRPPGPRLSAITTTFI